VHSAKYCILFKVGPETTSLWYHSFYKWFLFCPVSKFYDDAVASLLGGLITVLDRALRYFQNLRVVVRSNIYILR